MTRYKSIKEINDFLKFNVLNPPQREHSTNISLNDINALKHSRDYLDKMFKLHTQTIRNDTYKSNSSLCHNCLKWKPTFKIICFECVDKP